MPPLAQVGDFCPNTARANCGKPQGEQQTLWFGKPQAGRQRFERKTCGCTFTDTQGTVYYRPLTSKDEIIETLSLMAEGNLISSLARANGHKEGTTVHWI